jgi:hypothetical protein
MGEHDPRAARVAAGALAATLVLVLAWAGR